MIVPEDFNKYVGLPFKECGRGMDGFDCWGLVEHVYKDLEAVDIGSYAETYSDLNELTCLGLLRLIREEKRNWVQVHEEDAHPIDVIDLSILNCTPHVGVFVSPGKMLHIRERCTSEVTSYNSRAWAHRLQGFYRYAPRN